MSNRRIRETKHMMQHTCHTRKREGKASQDVQILKEAHGLSLGLTAVLQGLSISSPLKTWGLCGWEYRQLMKPKCHHLPAKIIKALSFPTFTQDISFWWLPFLFTYELLKSSTTSLQKGR